MEKVAERNVFTDYLLSTKGTVQPTGLNEVAENTYEHNQVVVVW
jgi:hypothetical protein